MRRKETPQQPLKTPASEKLKLKRLLFSSPPHYSDMSVSSRTIGMLETYPYHYMLAALFFGSILLRRWQLKGREGNPNGLPLPPGPKGYPLVGNVFDMPVNKPWVVFDEWRKTYGKTFIINALNLSTLTTGNFRRYHTRQCPWPALYDFKLLGSHQRSL